MRNTTLLQRGVVALLISALVVSAGASTALANTSASEPGPPNAPAQASDITINGLDIALKDVHITGNGLPEMSVEDRTYSVDEHTFTLDGMTVTINDIEIGFNDFTVTVEDSTLAIQNVGIDGE